MKTRIINTPEDQSSFGALVIGSRRDHFVERCIDILSDKGIDYQHCDDVYDAYSKFTSGLCREKSLVIGRLANLARENGRFLIKTARRGSLCCCLAGEQSDDRLLETVGRSDIEAFIISRADEVAEVIDKLTGTDAHGSARCENGPLLSEAEIDALLSD